jgi:hypothetical protein
MSPTLVIAIPVITDEIIAKSPSPIQHMFLITGYVGSEPVIVAADFVRFIRASIYTGVELGFKCGTLGFCSCSLCHNLGRRVGHTPLTERRKGTRTRPSGCGRTSMDSAFGFLRGSSSRSGSGGRVLAVVSLSEGAKLNAQACTSADK